MMDWIQGLPLVAAWSFLYVVILLRAGGTYLLGRLTHSGAERTRASALLRAPAVQRAQRTVAHRGAPIVALSFLTIGFQTAAQAAAGLLRMPYRKYLPALLLGGAAWALIYATVGLAAFWLWFQLLLQNPWIAAGLVVALLAAVAVLVVRVRHRRRRAVAAGAVGAAGAAPESAEAVAGPAAGSPTRA